MASFYSRVFGIFQKEGLSRENFKYIVALARNFEEASGGIQCYRREDGKEEVILEGDGGDEEESKKSFSIGGTGESRKSIEGEEGRKEDDGKIMEGEGKKREEREKVEGAGRKKIEGGGKEERRGGKEEERKGEVRGRKRDEEGGFLRLEEVERIVERTFQEEDMIRETLLMAMEEGKKKWKNEKKE